MRTIVCTVDEIAPGERRIVTAGSRSIGIFRVGDRFFGIRNRCPHQGGPLCTGHVLEDAVADGPQQARLTEGRPRVACPWHGWEYDLDSGQSFMGPAQPGVKSYGVGVESGAALAVEIESGTPTLRPGPYVAETFTVHVEDNYVVLET
jgi:3-phenylpropionate/trans-cinnamate dioxygenase ferredoxin subunit